MSSDQNGAPKSLSFGFSKKKATKTLAANKLSDGSEEKVDERDFVKDFDGTQRVKPKDLKETLVIPLKDNRKWWRPGTPENEVPEDEGERPKKKARIESALVGASGEDQLAAQEILKDARAQNEDWEARGKKEYDMTIPLKDRREEDMSEEEEKEEEETIVEANYDAVPIEAFGKGLLRGMGWKEGMGIGRNNQRIKPVESVARPKGLGLGADRSLAAQKGGPAKGGGGGGKEGEEEPRELKAGVCCVVTGGKHRDLYGMIEGTDEDNARVVIKLTLSGEKVTIAQAAVKAVSRKEYDKYSKYLNKGRSDKYKEKQAAKAAEEEERHHKKHKEERRDHSHRDSPSHHRDSEDYHRDVESRHRDKHDKRRDRHEDRKDKDRDSHKKSKSSQNSANGHSSKSIWLRPQLRVRVICPEYKKGRYFKTKVTVEDVISLDQCICRSDEGRILEDLSQSMLETVIPKSEGSHVMVVHGTHQGLLGEVLRRDKSRCSAAIQLLRDRDQVVTLDFDDICEYMGDVTQEDDY